MEAPKIQNPEIFFCLRPCWFNYFVKNSNGLLIFDKLFGCTIVSCSACWTTVDLEIWGPSFTRIGIRSGASRIFHLWEGTAGIMYLGGFRRITVWGLYHSHVV